MVGAPRQSGESFLGESLGNGGGAELVSRLFQGVLNVIDGVVLFSEGDDAFENDIALGRAARASGRGVKKGSLRVLAKLMTEDAKAAIAIAEALSDLLRRQMIDEESA